MGKLFVVLVCAVSLLRSQVQPQVNQPQLKRVGVAPLTEQGNLAGFRPSNPVWPILRSSYRPSVRPR